MKFVHNTPNLCKYTLNMFTKLLVLQDFGWSTMIYTKIISKRFLETTSESLRQSLFNFFSFFWFLFITVVLFWGFYWENFLSPEYWKPYLFIQPSESPPFPNHSNSLPFLRSHHSSPLWPLYRYSIQDVSKHPNNWNNLYVKGHTSRYSTSPNVKVNK